MLIAHALARLGGTAHVETLRHDGFSQKSIERAVHQGVVERVRAGWYCLPGSDHPVVQALRVGGKLSCVSLLRLYGTWLMPDDRLHVAVRHPHARLKSPKDRTIALDHWRGHPWVTTHWRAKLVDQREPTDLIDDAAACVATCLPRDHAIVAFDSLLNRKVLSAERLRLALASLPDSHEWMMTLVDAGCASGLETLARLALRSHNVRVRTQVHAPGIGWVDLLVGDRLVVELDSRTHHDNPSAYERDRARDLALIERGYIVVRVTYNRVMSDWASVERALLAVVRRDEHLWQPLHRRAGLTGFLE